MAGERIGISGDEGIELSANSVLREKRSSGREHGETNGSENPARKQQAARTTATILDLEREMPNLRSHASRVWRESQMALKNAPLDSSAKAAEAAYARCSDSIARCTAIAPPVKIGLSWTDVSREIAAACVLYGYVKIYVVLERGGFEDQPQAGLSIVP